MNGNRDIYVMDASGGNRVAVTSTPSQEIAPSWAPDGQSLLVGVLPDSSTEIPRDPGSRTGWGRPKPPRRIPIASISPDGSRILVGALGGIVCADCPRGLYILSRDWKNPVALNAPKVLGLHSNRGTLGWSRDARHAYIAVNENDGTSSIWQLPVGSDVERRVFHLVDPARQFFRPNLDVDSANFYVSIGGRQSDIWTIELKKQ
jgi:WD40 repeat protein